MSTPPPPPPGYQGYGAPAAGPAKYSGQAIAGLVLSLVAVIPCFWFWILQIPGYLGVIFSAIGLKQTKGGQRNGRGLAIAGLVVGIIAVALAALITIYVYTSDNCTNDGLFRFECTTN
jgi:uncharacterized membrane protein